ncbi:hypothetical protein [Nonomuraea turcica]|uniref:hypothetical protein n=1 Tax=Nonomuraea sp. G32 TaxID=3067274 RepID=UPI00273AE862|nr:hypothetical protein [Nonomuraea sp. G32]MDP4502422.1 hypothetical protein [Nonomuraea sp. G32]
MEPRRRAARTSRGERTGWPATPSARFAVVTALELDLFPAPSLYGGQVIWPIAHAEQVMAAFREIATAAPCCARWRPSPA